MLRGLREHLTYANVMATVAVFIALGGGAYALSSNSVESRHIVNEEVKPADVKDDSLTGDDVAFDSLTADDVDEASLSEFELPPTAGLATIIRNIGTGGTTMYGSPSGESAADANMSPVQMLGRAGDAFIVNRMFVRVDSAPGTGESRSFSVVRRASPSSAIFPTGIGCTIDEGEEQCSDEVNRYFVNFQLFAIEITNTGGGLPAGDEAYVGLGLGA